MAPATTARITMTAGRAIATNAVRWAGRPETAPIDPSLLAAPRGPLGYRDSRQVAPDRHCIAPLVSLSCPEPARGLGTPRHNKVPIAIQLNGNGIANASPPRPVPSSPARTRTSSSRKATAQKAWSIAIANDRTPTRARSQARAADADREQEDYPGAIECGRVASQPRSGAAQESEAMQLFLEPPDEPNRGSGEGEPCSDRQNHHEVRQ